MNDAERDAWLREALRHAPDSGATPPSVLSDAILAEARAAAARPTTRLSTRGDVRRASTNPFLAFWSWLARPPVAAGFASVMAATLVGLMWWDRPMDEALPRPPASAVDRVAAPRATAPAAPAAIGAAAPTPADAKEAAQSSTRPAVPPPARRAKVAETERAEATSAKDALAKERSRPTAPQNDNPAAFPAPEFQRDAPAPAPAPRTLAVPTPLADAKKEAAPTPAPPAPAAAPVPAPVLAPAPAPLAATQRQAPQAAAQTAPTQPSLARGRVASDEARDAPSNRLDSGVAKSGAARESVAEPKGDATAPTTAPAAPALRPPAFGQALEKKANAFSPEGAAARSEAPAEVRRSLGVAAPAPLAPLLPALAGDAARVSRQSASGGWVALDAAWRNWLTELDAATAGRWHVVIDASAALDADAAKQLGTPIILRLDGRPATTVRIDGATVQLESQIGTPQRWQAALAPAVGERLRASLARLPP